MNTVIIISKIFIYKLEKFINNYSKSFWILSFFYIKTILNKRDFKIIFRKRC